MKKPERQLVRAKKVIESLGVSRMTLWRWERNERGFPLPMRVGRITLYDINAVYAWLQEKNADNSTSAKKEVK